MKLTFRQKLLAGAGATFALLVIAPVLVYVNLTRLVRSALEKEVPGLTFKTLDVGWNKVRVDGVELQRGKKTVFKVDSLRVYPSLLSIFSDTLRISSIEIDKPYLFVVRNPNGSLTLPVPEEKGAPAKKPAEKKDGEASESRMRIDHLRISDGRAELEDRSVSGPPAKLALRDLDLKVDDVVLPMDDTKIPFELSTELEGKRVGKLEADGFYVAKSRTAEVDADLSSLFMPTAEPYYRSKLTTATLSDGIVDLETEVKMENGKYVADVELTFSDVAFSRDGLLFGVPVALFIDREKEQKEPFTLKTKIEGSLDEREDFQDKLLAALVKEVAKELGKKAAMNAVQDAAKKGLGEQGKGALESLFGR